jgi:hypothetical protein
MKPVAKATILALTAVLFVIACKSADTRPGGALPGEIRTVKLTLLGAD